MEHTRLWPLVDVPLIDIVSDINVEDDDPLLQLYRKLLDGEVKVGLTRMPIESVTTGSFKRTNGKVEHVSHLKVADIPLLEREIRSGGRPALDLYWNPHAPGGGGYVCADDEVVLAAYARLNFALVPCRILRPRKFASPEACIWIEQRGKHVGLARAFPPTVDKYALFAGNAVPPFRDLMGVLRERCRKTCTAIASFHRDVQSSVHYHQMLYTLVQRHERLLDSISYLAEIGRSEHASALIRVGYEAFLNFYIDWLSPEFFGPRLQFLSAIRSLGLRDSSKANRELAVLSNFPTFLERTSEKARISPLGSLYHNLVYPELSLVAHQSYRYLERDARGFGQKAEPEDSSVLEPLGRWLNVLTAALLIRVENDVGIPPDYSALADHPKKNV